MTLEERVWRALSRIYPVRASAAYITGYCHGIDGNELRVTALCESLREEGYVERKYIPGAKLYYYKLTQDGRDKAWANGYINYSVHKWHD